MTAMGSQAKGRLRRMFVAKLCLGGMLVLLASCGSKQDTAATPDEGSAAALPADSTTVVPTSIIEPTIKGRGKGAQTAPATPVPPPPLKRDVSYNKPSELNFGEPVQVKVIIRPPATPISGSFRGHAGEVTTAAIDVHEEVSAVLEGPTGRVEIVRRSGFPAWQSTTVGNPTWIWDVTAKAPGLADLDLTVKTKVQVNGAQTETIVETYHDVIPVRMGWIDAARWWIGQVDPIWKWLTGLAGALGVAFVWFRTQFGRTPS